MSTTPHLTLVTPILRGLLSHHTDNDDMPYRMVCLKTLPDAKATPKKPNATQLLVEIPEADFTADKLKQTLGDAIKKFESEHKSKPKTVSIPGLAVFEVNEGTAKDKPLANKVALITGAAGAIGYGICKGLLEAGCRLAATDLAGEKLDSFCAEFHKMGYPDVLGVPLDVTDKNSVAAGFAKVIQTWGGVDILVINAGIALACPLPQIDLEAFRKLERVNVEGTLLALAEAGRHFATQGTGGDIVLISTKNVYAPGAGFGAYSATKAAAHQLARIASLEFAPMGVRVNMVAPDAVFSGGAHKSGLWAEVGPSRMKARGLDEKGLEDYYRSRNLLKAQVTARHVANAVLFFATRQTPTTGACIPVDGGLPDATPR